MGRDEETPNRGMFGYEGEGFDFEDDPRPRARAGDRGWNIGRQDDSPDGGDAPAGEREVRESSNENGRA